MHKTTTTLRLPIATILVVNVGGVFLGRVSIECCCVFKLLFKMGDADPGNNYSNSHPGRGNGVTGELKVFVGGLSYSTTDDSLRDYFIHYGPVLKSNVAVDKETGNSRCFGFVVLGSQDALDQVLAPDIVNKHLIDGRTVTMKRAVSHAEHQALKNRTKKLYIGGVPQDLAEDKITLYFQQFGEVKDLQTFPESGGKSGGKKERRRYMFVTFGSYDSVDKCMEKTNHQIGHAKVQVKRSIPKDQGSAAKGRGQGGGGGHGGGGSRQGGRSGGRRDIQPYEGRSYGGGFGGGGGGYGGSNDWGGYGGAPRYGGDGANGGYGNNHDDFGRGYGSRGRGGGNCGGYGGGGGSGGYGPGYGNGAGGYSASGGYGVGGGDGGPGWNYDSGGPGDCEGHGPGFGGSRYGPLRGQSGRPGYHPYR